MDRDVSAFVSDHYVRLTWIAFFTQWVLWGLVYFLRHVFADPEKTSAADDAEAGEKKRFLPAGGFTVSCR